MISIDDYPEALVLRVNELVHDFDGAIYQDEVEGEMIAVEGERWVRTWRQHAPAAPRHVIDIGTGTGFVPLVLLPEMTPEDRLTCSDISADILELARESIERSGSPVPIDYRHLSHDAPFRLPFAERSADVITMNSVLHHLKDTEGFLREIDRVLRPGGLLFIGHEPNRRFRKSRTLKGIFWIMRSLFLTREAAIVLLRNIGVYDSLIRLRNRLRPVSGERILDYVNRHILEEGLYHRPLGAMEVLAITDIRDAEGFDPTTLLPGWEQVTLETYNHLLTVDTHYPNHRLVKGVTGSLAGRYPADGATFFMVVRKS